MGVSKGAPAALMGDAGDRLYADSEGDVWPSITAHLVGALALVDAEMAWDEWKKNSLACHAEVYPDIWYGICNGPDVFRAVPAKYAGQTSIIEALLVPQSH
jgi:hypothetical protein